MEKIDTREPTIARILSRGVAEVIDPAHLEHALRSGRKLRVKLGIDPTAPELHLGHTVPLRKLRQFQDAGHKAVLIIGDFTAQIGDPSGRSETRTPLTEKEIAANMKRYLAQAAKVIDVKNAEIRHNSEWHKKDGLRAFLELARSGTIGHVLERADFQKRIEQHKDISMLEVFYPLLQGYDSVKVKADVELGGTDQKFNLLMGRRVQRHFKMPEQDVMTLPLLEGTDGARKMSKSFGNTIPLEAVPDDMFGKIMAVPDALIEKYFALLTVLEPAKNLGPRDAKLLLAETIVATYHGAAVGQKAREQFIEVFSKNKFTKIDFPVLELEEKKISLIELVLKSGRAKSKSEARRLIMQGGVQIDSNVQKDPSYAFVPQNELVRIGKHYFLRLRAVDK